MTEPTLDLSAAPEAERAQRLGAAFVALAPGGSLTFATPGDPRKLVRDFVAKQWGHFDWAPLRAGDGRHLSQLSKRKQQGPHSILDMFGDDHRRCDELFANAESAAQQGDAALAADLFARYELGLQRHFRMEEEGIFPELDKRMGFMGGGPTMVMREEHQQMRGMLRRMAGSVEQGNLEEFLGACETMLYLMEQHNMKEEQMLYAMADDAFSADRDELLRRLVLF
ncbi:MAG: hemerythrin domain-containing protein [Candidatus Lambdaproteobacteria bacterium]|nr:hemerythrin domain-containing protein [Candidatus Lambdaproteobacteria bacterium]